MGEVLILNDKYAFKNLDRLKICLDNMIKQKNIINNLKEYIKYTQQDFWSPKIITEDTDVLTSKLFYENTFEELDDNSYHDCRLEYSYFDGDDIVSDVVIPTITKAELAVKIKDEALFLFADVLECFYDSKKLSATITKYTYEKEYIPYIYPLLCLKRIDMLLFQFLWSLTHCL